MLPMLRSTTEIMTAGHVNHKNEWIELKYHKEINSIKKNSDQKVYDELLVAVFCLIIFVVNAMVDMFRTPHPL